jgi:hypothetical protein
MEAFDTWRHPDVTFEQFKTHVRTDNAGIQVTSGKEAIYTTYYGNRIHFVIWNNLEHDYHFVGSKVLYIEYGTGDPSDTLVNAVDYADESQFLSGTVMRSAGDAVTEIHNVFLGTTIRLDWSDPTHLVRTSEDGTVEEAGRNRLTGQYYEVWVDFGWNGPNEGDFYRPFSNLASALAAVADGGVIKIAPGTTPERGLLRGGKRVRLVAPIGGVTIGASHM